MPRTRQYRAMGDKLNGRSVLVTGGTGPFGPRVNDRQHASQALQDFDT